jgi:hypothetical protein
MVPYGRCSVTSKSRSSVRVGRSVDFFFFVLSTFIITHFSFSSHTHHYKMPIAKISPSLLSGDFGILAAECKRMVSHGADWLHMGTLSLYVFFSLTLSLSLSLTMISRHSFAFKHIQSQC